MHTHVVVDELGHVVARRDHLAGATATAREYTEHRKIRGSFEAMSLDERSYRQSEFQRLQQAHEAKIMGETNQESWAFREP